MVNREVGRVEKCRKRLINVASFRVVDATIALIPEGSFADFYIGHAESKDRVFVKDGNPEVTVNVVRERDVYAVSASDASCTKVVNILGTLNG